MHHIKIIHYICSIKFNEMKVKKICLAFINATGMIYLPIGIVAILELIIHSVSHFLGSSTAKWHFIAWFIWLIIIIICKLSYNKRRTC